MEPIAHVSGKCTYYREYDPDELLYGMNVHFLFHFVARFHT